MIKAENDMKLLSNYEAKQHVCDVQQRVYSTASVRKKVLFSRLAMNELFGDS